MPLFALESFEGDHETIRQKESTMIEFTKIKHDTNGKPRYVCHFLNLNTEQEKSQETHDTYGFKAISTMYAWAVKRAKKIGGRKFSNRSFGGGIVFQSYNIRETERDILRIVAQEAGNG